VKLHNWACWYASGRYLYCHPNPLSIPAHSDKLAHISILRLNPDNKYIENCLKKIRGFLND
jgi:hypothetical protein